MSFDEVYLAGRTLSKLDELKASILKETPDAKVYTTIDYNDLLADMDMIVTSTSGAGKEILDIMRVKPGCVITDVARPLDLPASDVAKRPDVLVIESGEIDLPTKVKGLKSIGLPPNVIYACLAETIVLALEGRFEVFTVGRDTEWEKVKEIYKLGLKHGMKLAAISGVNGVFSDEAIAKVVTLARKARLTWKDAKAAPKAAAKTAPARKAPRKKASRRKAGGQVQAREVGRSEGARAQGSRQSSARSEKGSHQGGSQESPREETRLSRHRPPGAAYFFSSQPRPLACRLWT